MADEEQAQSLQDQSANQGFFRADILYQKATEKGRKEVAYRTSRKYSAGLEVAPVKIADYFRYRRANEDHAGTKEHEIGTIGG